MKTIALTAGWPKVISLLVLSFSTFSARSVVLKPQMPLPSIELSTTPADAPKRSITLDDMLSLREIHEPRQSPDGQRVAFLVKQAFRKCDCYRTALYVTSVKNDAPAQKLAEEGYLANLQWTPDGKTVSFLSSRGGTVQLWQLNVGTRRAAQVFVHTPNGDMTADHATLQSIYLPASGVLDYRWSPDGMLIAFTAEVPVDPSLAANAALKGFRYDDAKMRSTDLVVGDWATGNRSKQLWLYDRRLKRARMVWSGSTGSSTRVNTFLWAPSSKKLMFSYSTDDSFGSDVMAELDAVTSTVSPLGSAGGGIEPGGAIWSADERQIAYLARIPPSSSYKLVAYDTVDGSRKELYRDIYAGHFAWLAWDTGRHQILFLSEGLGRNRQQTGLYAIPENGGPSIRLTDLASKVDECGLVRMETIACVGQSPSSSPRPALVSVTDGRVRSLTDVNPEIAAVELAPVRELHWSNKNNDETNGFLILPERRSPGQRVPLVVIGYSFSGEFVTQANTLLTTYPAQAFTRDGIAVLLFNYPRYEAWKGKDFGVTSKDVGYGPVSSIQAIVDQLTADGVIDPDRVGMMGHSLAGFWTQLAITHTKLFKAVEMHNGGTFSEPGTYWIGGSKTFREVQELVMGGPPYGTTLKNYLGFSMSLNADRIRAPVLMEYDALEALSALEYFGAMKHYNVPVDLYIYPNDGHVTEHPEHRFMSMQRNLDWFEFWLLDRENDAPNQLEQYARWRAFRAVVKSQSAADGLTQ